VVEVQVFVKPGSALKQHCLGSNFIIFGVRRGPQFPFCFICTQSGPVLAICPALPATTIRTAKCPNTKMMFGGGHSVGALQGAKISQILKTTLFGTRSQDVIPSPARESEKHPGHDSMK
jgi:hypothetical protein